MVTKVFWVDCMALRIADFSMSMGMATALVLDVTRLEGTRLRAPCINAIKVFKAEGWNATTCNGDAARAVKPPET